MYSITSEVRLRSTYYSKADIRVYVDMDGVLVDFDRAVDDVAPFKIASVRDGHVTDEEFVLWVNRQGESFWADMPWMPHGKRLWSLIKETCASFGIVAPIILSSPAEDRFDYSIKGKTAWLRFNIPEVVLQRRFILSSAKTAYAFPYTVLIDDWDRYIEPWKERSGVAIKHEGYVEETIADLASALGKLVAFAKN